MTRPSPTCHTRYSFDSSVSFQSLPSARWQFPANAHPSDTVNCEHSRRRRKKKPSRNQLTSLFTPKGSAQGRIHARMSNPLDFLEPGAATRRSTSKAGIVSRIRLENFMCHSNLEIELGDYVNFITGQNGSGKSAILTALCVAFGCRARSTQRASTLKDFIKTGCGYALVVVHVKNLGDDAFKHNLYGDMIIIERRITESASSTTIKDCQGRKIASGREKLTELVEHFNIDVENPCVIMTQDKSREFLHSGNSKDKFQFFYKATLLQVVDELLMRIKYHIESANALVAELEKSIQPVVMELRALERKIESLEQVERIAEQVRQLRKQLAWARVYDDDKKVQEQDAKVEKSKNNKKTCEDGRNKYTKVLEELNEFYIKKEAESQGLIENSSSMTKKRDELHDRLKMAVIEKRQLEEDHVNKTLKLEKIRSHLKTLQEKVLGAQEQLFKESQDEQFAMKETLKALEDEIDKVNSLLMRLSDDESSLSETIALRETETREIKAEIEGKERKRRECSFRISDLEKSETNKVNAFGGAKVYQLLEVIERHHHKFKRPPIGPIGAHLTLLQGDSWASAVENAVGRLFNAFIVTDHKDSLLLRSCAREAQYQNLQIIIYDFSKSRLSIPQNMLPQTSHPTVFSVLHSDNPTVMNVLVDMGSAERQVLVEDYAVGKTVAFSHRIPNLKEVYTKDGYKLFSRGSVQTTLPPMKRARTSRLSSSYAEEIEELKRDLVKMGEQMQKDLQRKRTAEDDIRDLQEKLQNVKRRRLNLNKDLTTKKMNYQAQKDSYEAAMITAPVSSVDELSEDISIAESKIQEQEFVLERLLEQMKKVDSKVESLKESYEKLRESAQVESNAMNEVCQELQKLQDQINDANKKKKRYENLLIEKVLPDIQANEEEFQILKKKREEDFEKANQICPESEIKALGGCMDSTPEQLGHRLSKLKERLKHEIEKSTESLDELRSIYQDKQNKISRRKRIYEDFRQKLNACEIALNMRQKKFERSATLLSRELTWQFNRHLGRKGISGKIEVDYQKKTLSIEVTMPQDVSSEAVRDTRGLSGGERSFSTLCFTLTLHSMTESPFRAMDEFDVFMDAVSRKISMDILIEFALLQGSQWIFITPHDISMIKQGEKIKKQQMAAPRS